jgi:hypothetical protein
MNKLWPRSWGAAMLVALVATLAAAVGAPARADPPYRVMQLAHASGSVSFQPSSTDEWLRATPNRPLVPGDALWVDEGARAELRTTGTALRLHGNTSVELLNLDDRIAQLRLSQGTLILSVRRMTAGQVIEIDTPNLAFRPDRPGLYRIDVAPSGEWTDVAMRRGAARAFGEGRAFTLAEGRTLRFYGTDLADHDSFALAPRDAFDRWSSERDRRWHNAVAARHVSPDLIGYEDLDDHGRWQRHAHYGSVWIPERLPAGWVPYRDGHWAWIEPWGWTWIDDAPWGFAPSHYGRWTRIDTAWAWIPGPVRMRPVYAPAMVQFVGSGAHIGASFTLGGVPGVAWFALGPQEVYRPAYTVSPAYLRAVNVGNALIPPARITNVTVNVTQVTNVYVNPRQGALVAMPAADFVRARPVAAAAWRVAPQDLLRAPVATAPATRPTLASIVGAAPAASGRPPREAFERRVIARAAPPAPAVPEVRVVQAPPTALPLPPAMARRERRGEGRAADGLRPGHGRPVASAPPAPVPPPQPQQPLQTREQAPGQAQRAQQQAGRQAAAGAEQRAQQEVPQQAQRLAPRQAQGPQAQPQAQQQAQQQAERHARQQAQLNQAQQQAQQQAQLQQAQRQAQQQAERQAQEQALRQAQQQAQQEARQQQARRQAQQEAQQEAQRQAHARQEAQRRQRDQQQAERRRADDESRRAAPRRDEPPPGQPRLHAPPPPPAPAAAQAPRARAPVEAPRQAARTEPSHAQAPPAPPRQEARNEPPRPAPRAEPQRSPPSRADAPRDQRAAAEDDRKNDPGARTKKGRHRDEG